MKKTGWPILLLIAFDMSISIRHNCVWMMCCYDLCTQNLAIDLISYLVARRCAQIHIILPRFLFHRFAPIKNLASLGLHSDKVTRPILGDVMPQKNDRPIELKYINFFGPLKCNHPCCSSKMFRHCVQVVQHGTLLRAGDA